ncbi:MAG: beta-ketoacyl-ACP synthase, partial [Actinomycetota bacterium]|nr:beta-ketoacyl-ACP synthase [Actinomycetota bacterium]
DLIPPTANTKNVDPEIHIDVVTGSPRPLPKGAIISNSFGFGGHNGTLVLTRYQG